MHFPSYRIFPFLWSPRPCLFSSSPNVFSSFLVSNGRALLLRLWFMSDVKRVGLGSSFSLVSNGRASFSWSAMTVPLMFGVPVFCLDFGQ